MALNEKAGGFQRENLVADAEVRRLEPLDHHEGGLAVPRQNDCDQQWHPDAAKVGIVATRVRGHLIAVGNRHMEMASALVIRVHRRAEGAVRVVFALATDNFVVASNRVTMPARSMTAVFVRSAILKRDAKHLSRGKRDQTLHEQQEHGNEFDQIRGHQWIVSDWEIIHLNPVRVRAVDRPGRAYTASGGQVTR